jgi:hypothetical protein
VNQTAGTYVVPNTLGLGSALDVLNQTPGNSIVVTSGAIAALGGIVGPTSANRVLVGQFTTNGTFTFKLNVQLLNPVGVAENYVHTTLAGGQLTHPTLTRGVNIAPTVNVTAPSNGATLATGSSVTISANAGDVSGGSISQVEFREWHFHRSGSNCTLFCELDSSCRFCGNNRCGYRQRLYYHYFGNGECNGWRSNYSNE